MNARDFTVGDRVRCKDDGMLGTITDRGFSAVRVARDDGLASTHLQHEDPIIEHVDEEPAA